MRNPVFWFRNADQGKAHACELVDGEFEPFSACDRMVIDKVDDLPLSARERHGHMCLFCKVEVFADSRPSPFPKRRDGRRRASK